jgi:hypothetical protein
MKVRLSVHKAGKRLHEGDYDIVDTRSLGEAVARAWSDVEAQRLGKATSVGALMETLGEGGLDELDGAQFSLRKL